MVLWCLVAVLLLRGAGDVLATSPAQPVAHSAHRSAAPVWPDDRARGFAVQFARAYLTHTPERASTEARELLAFVAPELTDSVVPRFAPHASRQVPQNAVVAGVERVDRSHALITVATTVSGTSSSSVFLVVPVARDERGGLVVYDLPSFAGPPARGQVDAAEADPLTGTDAAAIEDVLARFLRSFLAGRSDELEYLVPAGARIGALADPVELLGVDSVAEVTPARADERLVVATVRARDPESKAVFALRYRVRLLHGDRWYVAAINTTRQEG